jgi:starch-binding outer membrane protein, SusD/RagB family
MRTVRAIQNSLLIAILLFIVFSCNKKLDEPLDQEFLAEDIDYTKTEDMFPILIGAYGHLEYLQWEIFPLISVRGDDVNSRGVQFPLQEADAFRYDPSAWIHNSVWTNLYADIFNFNAAIEEILKYKEFADKPAIADQYIAEIQVMKAWELLQLIRTWGEIFMPETSLAIELYDLELPTFEEGLQYISDLMDEAIPLLPDLHPNQRTDVPGGMTRYTALAVKTLVNLELKNWDEVTAATDQIIASGYFSLETDYYNLFKTAGKLNDENILELQYSDYGQSSGESEYYLHSFFGPQGWSPLVPGSEGGWGYWEPTLKYIKFMLDRGEGLRLQTSVLFTNAGIAELQSDPDYTTLPEWISNVTPNGDTINDHARAIFASGKHYLPSEELIDGRTRYGSNKNFICIRYSEILLSHAEALTQGATSTVMSADEAVNEVRNRAELDPLSGVTLDDVLDEKFAELAMEWGIRFYDVVRHGKTDELNHNGWTYTDDKRFYVYPIVQMDILPQLRSE